MPTPSSSSTNPNPNPSTVQYDTERSATSLESLDPPDMTQFRARKLWYHPSRYDFTFPRKVQLPLTCVCIALSAVQANGVYSFPTYGPVIAKNLELDGAEVQTIVVGGILGVYLTAAPLGSFTDRYGIRFGSCLSAVLASMGYLTFALILDHATPDTPFVLAYLTAAFFCVGAATVGTYFACLTCASLSFPAFPTLSLSVPLSLVGLSSLFLSSFSTLSIFQTPDPNSDLDPIKFLKFLALLCPSINLFSGIFMRVLPPVLPPPRLHTDDDDGSDDGAEMDADALAAMSQSLQLDERTPLLIGGIEAAREEVELMERGKHKKWTAWSLVKDWEGFWAFGIILALCIGPSETVIASVGSILTSLLLPISSLTNTAQPHQLALRNKHVMILSLTSTFSRLLTGVIADWLCPPPVAVPAPPSSDPDAPTHLFIRKRPIKLYRSMFAAICSVGLSLIYAWSAGWLKSERGLWVLSGGVGTLYGAVFTLTPAMVSAHFGPTNFGLAWGMVSYFSAMGSVLFSYLYGILSVAVAEESKYTNPSSLKSSRGGANGTITCYGTKCFSPALWVAAVCALASTLGFILLARRWKV